MLRQVIVKDMLLHIYIYIYITSLPINLLSMLLNQQEFRLFPKTNGKSSVESQETEIYFLRKHGLFTPTEGEIVSCLVT